MSTASIVDWLQEHGVESEALARLALSAVGNDATPDECSRFLHAIGQGAKMSGGCVITTITAECVNRYRDQDSQLYTKEDRRLQLADWLIQTPDGRAAIREAIRRFASKEQILDLLGIKTDE